MRLRVAVAFAVVTLGAGYLLGRDPPPREKGPGGALRAYQRARVEALGECAKYGFATQWGDLAPDSRLQYECMSLSVQPCTSYSVPDVTSDERDVGPRL